MPENFDISVSVENVFMHILTLGTNLKNNSKRLWLPDLATMSLWHEEEVVTARANELARDFVEWEALGRGI